MKLQLFEKQISECGLWAPVFAQTIAAHAPNPDVCLSHRATFPLPHPSWRNTAWLGKNPWFDAELIPSLHRTIAKELAHDPA